MAARALQLSPQRTPFADAHGGQAGLAFAPALGQATIGFDRFVALAVPALRETCGAGSSATPVAIVLALPDKDRPDQRDARFEHELLPAIARAAGLTLDSRKSRVVRAGHAGFAHALAIALGELGSCPAGVVAGAIDTPFHPEVVRWLDERGKLMRVEHDGGGAPIPGEAAAFVHLKLERLTRRNRDAASLSSVELGEQREGEGSGLGRLLRRVGRGTARGPLAWLLSDVNGEPQRTDDWLAATDEAHDLLADVVHQDLVQHTADVGAAAGALLAVIALTWARTGAVTAPNVAIATSADGAERGVFVLDLPSAGRGFRASTTSPLVHPLGASPLAVRPSAAERAELRRLVNSCLEDIGSMGMLLTPGAAGEPPAEEEASRRLLDCLDCVAAVGTAVPFTVSEPEILRLLDEHVGARAGQRPREFAASFVKAHLRAPRARSAQR